MDHICGLHSEKDNNKTPRKTFMVYQKEVIQTIHLVQELYETSIFFHNMRTEVNQLLPATPSVVYITIIFHLNPGLVPN